MPSFPLPLVPPSQICLGMTWRSKVASERGIGRVRERLKSEKVPSTTISTVGREGGGNGRWEGGKEGGSEGRTETEQSHSGEISRRLSKVTSNLRVDTHFLDALFLPPSLSFVLLATLLSPLPKFLLFTLIIFFLPPRRPPLDPLLRLRALLSFFLTGR